MERGSSQPRGPVSPSSEHRDGPPGRSHPSCPAPRPPASCPASSASGNGRDESPGRVCGNTVWGRGGIANDRPSGAPAAVLSGRARAFDTKVPTWWSAASHTGRGSGHTPSGRVPASSQHSRPHAAGGQQHHVPHSPMAPKRPHVCHCRSPPALSVPPGPPCHLPWPRGARKGHGAGRTPVLATRVSFGPGQAFRVRGKG